jgi:hypothetical protein
VLPAHARRPAAGFGAALEVGERVGARHPGAYALAAAAACCAFS